MGLRSRLRRLLAPPPTPRSAPAPRAPAPARPPPLPATRWTLRDRDLAARPEALLHPHLVAALAEADPTALLTPLAPGLYTLPVLTDAARQRLLDELGAIHAAVRAGTLDLQAPNSMHGYGVMLADAELLPLAEALSRVVQALAPAFSDLGPVDLHDPHGFCVTYGPDADRDLGFHADDATLTLNLCLDSDASGSEVAFEGVRCAAHRQGPTRPEERVTWRPRPGEALLHLGAHRHLTRPIRGGRRSNLIVWCRDRARVDLGACGPWCGDHAGAAPRA